MTRKKFIKKITFMYAQIIKIAKENGQDTDLIRSGCLVRAKDYKLPKGKTYQEVWDFFSATIHDVYGIK